MQSDGPHFCYALAMTFHVNKAIQKANRRRTLCLTDIYSLTRTAELWQCLQSVHFQVKTTVR